MEEAARTMAGSAAPMSPHFEVGLSLAGAVSGGAYTAGVIDFLVEALDAFDAARSAGDAPDHRVVVKTVAGASSGALTAAALAAAIRYDFPHVRADTTAHVAAQNPLYDSWVNMTDITHLLGSRDRDDDPLPSLLDSTRLADVVRKAIDYGVGVGIAPRHWVAEPLRCSFSVTNLRGVPFSLNRRGLTGPQMARHADTMRFALTGVGHHHVEPVRADERALPFPPHPLQKWECWGQDFSDAALASAAFPLVLAARSLRRPTSDYDHVTAPEPQDGGRLTPSWSRDHPDPGPYYRFAAVDGGLLDNSPTAVARADLNGRAMDAHSPRDGNHSDRAVLMIEPMIGAIAAGPADGAGLPLRAIATSVVTALVNQARFRPAEVALAQAEEVYNRFLIAPGRSRDLAGSFLSGLGGYLSREFRRHDFLLGRCHAQRYLADKLVLKPENPLFARWNHAQRARYAVPESGELPIVPLVGALHPRHGALESTPAWPRGQADPVAQAPAIDGRLDVIFRALTRHVWWRFPAYLAWRLLARRRVREWLLDRVVRALEDHGLV